MTLSQIDAIVDADDDMDRAARDLADALDREGAWDWTDGSDHDPSDRYAVVESSGAWWLVYRGTEPDTISRYASNDEAWSALREAQS